MDALRLALALALCAGCSREQDVHAIEPAPETRASTTPTLPPPSSTIAPSSSSTSSASSGFSATHRPLTPDEEKDNCGYKGDLICCLGPKMPGPPPKPQCHPQ